MIKETNVEYIKRVINKLLITYTKNSVISTIQGIYQGSYFDNINNVLTVQLEVTAKHIIGGEESVVKETREIKIQFEQDYSNLKQKHFDNLLNFMTLSRIENNAYITLNRNVNYYDIIYNIYKFFYVDLKGNTKRKADNITEQMKTVKGTTLQNKKGYKVYLHDLTKRGLEGGVFTLEGQNDSYKITMYHNGRAITLLVKGGKYKLSAREYKRLPNGSNRSWEVIFRRYLDNKDIQTGNEIKNSSYLRALNAIKMSDVGFSVEDKDIYKNSDGYYFRVEIKREERFDNMYLITFYYLTNNRQGTKTSSYYLDQIFNGTFNDLDLWSSEPEWFIDGHVLSDIYEDHIEGVLGKDGLVGNI